MNHPRPIRSRLLPALMFPDDVIRKHERARIVAQAESRLHGSVFR